jgi:hypothetical protein
MHPARVTTIVIICIIIALGGVGGFFYSASQHPSAVTNAYTTKKARSKPTPSTRGAKALAARALKKKQRAPVKDTQADEHAEEHADVHAEEHAEEHEQEHEQEHKANDDDDTHLAPHTGYARHYGTSPTTGLRELLTDIKSTGDDGLGPVSEMEDFEVERHIVVYLSDTFGISVRELSALDADGLLETATVLTNPAKVRDLRKMKGFVHQVQVGEQELAQKLSDWDFLELDDETQAELAPFRKKTKEVKLAARKASSVLSGMVYKAAKAAAPQPGTARYKYRMEQRAKRKKARDKRRKGGIKQAVRYIRANAERAHDITDSDQFKAEAAGMSIHGSIVQMNEDLRASTAGLHGMTKKLSVSDEIMGTKKGADYDDEYDF